MKGCVKMSSKRTLKEIADINTDFAQWYTDVVTKAELIDYSSVKGMMIFRPYGFAIWELIQKELDVRIKQSGHQNVYMPLLIPERLLQIEKDHVEGFAPEVAWVTQVGDDALNERLCIRPTSEALFCEHFSKIVKSYQDLPLKYNQWCSVLRWEKATRPFLRNTEFLWQEGHTVHATELEAEQEALQMIEMYQQFCKEMLAIPVVLGRKTEKEKFAGAKATYTIESLMHDGKALQTATSHNLSDNFAKVFNIQFLNDKGTLEYGHQTSWGITTRLIGALIMVHGDESGLIIPPKIAPVQVMVVPIAQNKEGVVEKANALKQQLSEFARVDIDIRDKTPGWKFSEHEMRGVPLRLEVGPRDIEQEQVVLVRRDTKEKQIVPMDQLDEVIPALLETIQTEMYEKALQHNNEHTYDATTYDEMTTLAQTKPGFIKAHWCGSEECEQQLRDETGLISRCIVEESDHEEHCVRCQQKAKHLVYWGKAY